MIEYPKTLFKTGRKGAEKNTIFSVDGEFYLPEENDSPLMLFNKSFSKFKFNLVESPHNGKPVAVAVNLDLEKISLIKEKTTFILNKLFEREMSVSAPSETAEQDICWTKFTMGNFKGKSPAEIILQSKNIQSDLEELNKQYTFLKQNAEKFPKNKILMQAIVETAKKYKAGELTKENVGEIKQEIETFNILEKDFKYPRISKKDPQGYTKYTNLSIQCMLNNKSPFVVTMTNGLVYAGEGNEVDMKKTKDVIQKSFTLTTDEYVALIDCLYNRKLEFEVCNFNKQYKIAIENSWRPQA